MEFVVQYNSRFNKIYKFIIMLSYITIQTISANKLHLLFGSQMCLCFVHSINLVIELAITKYKSTESHTAGFLNFTSPAKLTLSTDKRNHNISHYTRLQCQYSRTPLQRPVLSHHHFFLTNVPLYKGHLLCSGHLGFIPRVAFCKRVPLY